jgi:hypothetical protein
LSIAPTRTSGLSTCLNRLNVFVKGNPLVRIAGVE